MFFKDNFGQKISSSYSNFFCWLLQKRWTLKGFIKVHLHEKYKRNDQQPKFWAHQLIFHIMSGIQKCICASLWRMRNMYKDGLKYTKFYSAVMIMLLKVLQFLFQAASDLCFCPPNKKYIRNGCHISFKFAASCLIKPIAPFFIGPRYTWGPIYGSGCQSLMFG